MKKTIIIYSAILLFAGCAKEMAGPENDANVGTGVISEITASFTDETKTSLNGLSMVWSDGDAINVAVDPVLDKGSENVVLNRFSLISGAGEKSAVFSTETPVSGSALHAVYPADRTYSKAGEKYIYFDYPSVQNYVPGGIEDGLIPMYAYNFSPTENACFMYGSGIMRLNIYSTDDVSIDRIVVTTDSPASGVFVVDPGLKRMPRVKNGTNNSTEITYNVGGVALSKDKARPTEFNICLANTKTNGANVTGEGTYKTLSVSIYAEDGSVYTVSKTDQVVEGGVIYNMPVLEYKGEISYKVGDYWPVPTVDISDPEQVAKVKGIVFSVDDTGGHGKIFSLEEGSGLQWSLTGTVDNTDDRAEGSVNYNTILTLEEADPSTVQYPAFAWAAGLGDGWYIPALDELVAIHTLRGDLSVDKNALNKKLTDVGAVPFSDYFYYSSTEYDVSDAEGQSQRNKVYMVNFKRASSATDLISGALKSASNSDKCVFRAVKAF